MKKISFLAIVLCMAISSQAAAIKWGGGGTAYLVANSIAEQARADDGSNADILSSYLADCSLVLVYLGVNGTATTAANVTGGQIVSTVALDDFLTKNTTAVKTGRANFLSSYSAPDVVNATYQVFFSYNGTLADVYTTSAMTTPFATTTKVAFDGSVYSATDLFASGASLTSFYAPVPEPATAALAIAGLAMLIRRRRA